VTSRSRLRYRGEAGGVNSCLHRSKPWDPGRICQPSRRADGMLAVTVGEPNHGLNVKPGRCSGRGSSGRFPVRDRPGLSPLGLELGRH